MWYQYHCLYNCSYRNTTRGFSTVAAINNDDLHLFSRHEPLQKCAQYSKNLHKHKNARNDQRHLLLHKMRAKHELGVLKSYINVALLCIQQQCLNFSYYRLCITQKNWLQFETITVNFVVCIENKGMTIFSLSQKETISMSLNYTKWTCAK